MQFNETLALLFFFGGLAVMLYGAIMSQRALREANRSTRWRNYMPRLEDLPPIAVRRLDPEAVDLRRWADAAVGTVVASVVLGWLAETLLT